MQNKESKQYDFPMPIYHTDSVLRKYGLLVAQDGFGEGAKFYFVDNQTYRKPSKKRITAFEEANRSRMVTTCS